MYSMLKRMIQKGLLDEAQSKLDVFFARDRITQEQYEELCALVQEEN